MAKARENHKANGRAVEVQTFVKTQLAGARSRLGELETEAGKVLKTAQRNATKQIDLLRERIQPAEAAAQDAVKDLGKRANEATTELAKLVGELQTRLIEVIGVASQSQVREISREISRLSKKIDGLAGKKPGKKTAQA